MILGMCVSLALASSVVTAPTPVVRYDAGTPPQTRLWLPVIAYNRDKPEDPFTAPDPDSFARHAAEVARNSEGRAIAYEIWNEPNLDRFWRSPDPVAYAKVYLKARAAIKAVAPNATVIAGGLADINGWEEYARTVVRLAKPDALAIHPYIYPVKSTKRALKLGVPIWITEVGVGREHITEPQRARYLARTIRNLRRLPIKGLFVFAWDDVNFGTNTGPANIALLHALSEK